MIRQANKYDKISIIEMIKEFGKESKLEHLNDLKDDYLDSLFNTLFAGLGIVYIEENKGVIAGIINPSVWNKDFFMLHELAWYVKPEYRSTPIGYRLFKEYMKKAEELKDVGRIQAIVMGKLASSPDIKYNKFGFDKLEESWIK
jgi:N-acetylglutamate synthase-like GNAT family acetyltransferase